MHWPSVPFSSRGRMGPARWRALALVLFGAALGLDLLFAESVVSLLIGLPGRLGLPESLIYLVFVPGFTHLLSCLPVVWPLWAVSAKRLHDLGYSGWWLLPLPFIPMLILWVWVMALLALRDGQPGPNRYGPALDARDDERIIALFS
ncbi:DUF805 domain-containing protein [Labrys neptuniae]